MFNVSHDIFEKNQHVILFNKNKKHWKLFNFVLATYTGSLNGECVRS